MELCFLKFATNSVEYCFPHFPQILWNTVSRNFHKFFGIPFSTNSVEYCFPHYPQIMWNTVFHKLCGKSISTFSTKFCGIPFSTNYVENRVPHFPQILWNTFFHIPVEFGLPQIEFSTEFVENIFCGIHFSRS